jgi:hypothetical protein
MAPMHPRLLEHSPCAALSGIPHTDLFEPVRNETPRRLVQSFLKIQLHVELAVNTLQECHDTGAAQLKRLMLRGNEETTPDFAG